MNLLKKLFVTIAVVLVLFFLGGFLISPDFKVERSVEINAQPEDIYVHLVDLKAWRKWAVWFQRDPNITVDYTGPDKNIGMKSSWVSESEGSGNMTITHIEAGQRLVYRLEFPDYDMQSTGEFLLTKTSDNKTKVVWMDYGEVTGGPVNRYFTLVLDSMIGPDFESGLANLKSQVEQK